MKKFLSTFALLSAALAPAAFAAKAEGGGGPTLSTSAFVDARFSPQAAFGAPYGFTVGDGALYLDAKWGKTQAYIDLDFAGGAASNAFFFSLGKSQAFVGQEFENGLKLKFGQWDTLFGFESNDSIDRRWTNFGIMSNELQIFTNTGLQVTYGLREGLDLTAYFSNGQNFGLSSGRMFSGNPEMGAFLNWTQESAHASGGGYYGKANTAGESNWLLNAQAGSAVGPLAIDLEFDLRKTESYADKAWGIMLNLDYAASEKLSLAGRFEYLKNGPVFPGVASLAPPIFDKQMQATVGPQYSIAERTKLRFDYSFTRNSTTAGDTNNHNFVVAAVVGF